MRLLTKVSPTHMLCVALRCVALRYVALDFELVELNNGVQIVVFKIA